MKINMNLLAVLDRPIAFHRAFVDLGAGVTGALMLSQAIYWARRTADPDGWFYKTQAEWTEEIGLTRTEQEGARKALKALGILQEAKRGVPCRLFYRICPQSLESRLFAENLQTGMQETRKQACGKPASRHAENPQSITETTQRLHNDYYIGSAPTGAPNPVGGSDLVSDDQAKPQKPKRVNQSRASQSAPMPEGFAPSPQHVELAKSLRVDLGAEFAQFVDFHAAKGNKFKDWHAALRTWLRNASKYNRAPQGGGPRRTGYIDQSAPKDYRKGVQDNGSF